MPFRPHPNQPKRFRARYRIRNWPQYEAGLKRRGDLTLWLEEAAIAGWQASRRTTPGGQARYSDLAIELVLPLRGIVICGRPRWARVLLSGSARWSGAVIYAACVCGTDGRGP